MARHPYHDLLSAPGVGRLLASATVGRLPLGMAGLAILLLVRDEAGSYAAAGLAAGALGLGGALGAPVLRPARPARRPPRAAAGAAAGGARRQRCAGRDGPRGRPRGRAGAGRAVGP